MYEQAIEQHNANESILYDALSHAENMGNHDFIRYFEMLRQGIEQLGGRYVEDWKSEISTLATETPNLLVRRESPKAILGALDHHRPLEVAPITGADKESEDGLYPNAGVLGNGGYGLRIPFQRGFGMVEDSDIKGSVMQDRKRRGIACIVGFEASRDLCVEKIKPGTFQRYDGDPEEKSLVRMIRGSVPPESIRFVLFRMPINHVPESFLTDEELDQKEESQKGLRRGSVGMIHRMFVFPKALLN